MEFKRVVYNAARDGKLHRLRLFLDHRSKDDIAMLVHSKTNAATPLIMACRNGHLNVVEYLIDKCHTDIEQVGSVTFDGETIEAAPPLWCAAAAGHMSIVRCMIKSGADVNSTTLTNSTPLRAACFDGHIDIVSYLVEHGANIEIANRHGHTCLMIACYKGHMKIVKYLLEKKANVNRKSIKGNTALHDCAESGSLEIMKLLLHWNAKMEKDSYGMTPLMAAAVTGHTKIVEYLTTQQECSRLQKIDALELLGSTYVDKKRDMLGALKYWRQSMDERTNDPVLHKPKTDLRIAAYENSIEVQTSEELDELISEPDDMRMQALLVRERILGPAHPDTSYYIRYRGAVYADMGNFDRCIMLWTYALDMQQKILEALSPMTQSSLLSFAELFSFMISERKFRPAYPVSFHDMVVVLDKSLNELEAGKAHLNKQPDSVERDASHLNRLLVIVMHLICLLCKINRRMTDTETDRLKQTVYRLVKLDIKGAKGYTPLHLACSKDTSTVGRYPVCVFPSPEVVSLLIEVGAAVNAVDADLNAPLHIAAVNQPCKSSVIRLLLEKGAHLDACNAQHVTATELMKNSIYDMLCPLDYTNLQCLAARRIMDLGVPFKGHIPRKLEAFVQMH